MKVLSCLDTGDVVEKPPATGMYASESRSAVAQVISRPEPADPELCYIWHVFEKRRIEILPIRIDFTSAHVCPFVTLDRSNPPGLEWGEDGKTRPSKTAKTVISSLCDGRI